MPAGLTSASTCILLPSGTEFDCKAFDAASKTDDRCGVRGDDGVWIIERAPNGSTFATWFFLGWCYRFSIVRGRSNGRQALDLLPDLRKRKVHRASELLDCVQI